MSERHKRTGKSFHWMGMMVVLAALLLASAGPGDAWRGGHGFGGRGFHGFHRFGGPRVGIGIGIGPFWGPFWAPYAAPVVVPPPVVVTPAPSVVVPPAAPAPSWYYCENPPGYYPYVAQCPGGWRQVPAQPQ